MKSISEKTKKKLIAMGEEKRLEREKRRIALKTDPSLKYIRKHGHESQKT